MKKDQENVHLCLQNTQLSSFGHQKTLLKHFC